MFNLESVLFADHHGQVWWGLGYVQIACAISHHPICLLIPDLFTRYSLCALCLAICSGI